MSDTTIDQPEPAKPETPEGTEPAPSPRQDRPRSDILGSLTDDHPEWAAAISRAPVGDPDVDWASVHAKAADCHTISAAEQAGMLDRDITEAAAASAAQAAA